MADGDATRDAIYCARPTLRFSGEADARASHLVQELRMSEGEGGLRALELVLSDWASTTDGGAERAFEGSANLRLGAEIEVGIGPQDAPVGIFRGRISGLESLYENGQAPRLRVLSEDALLGARLARRSRVFSDCSPADVVRQIASGLGLECVVAGLQSPVATRVQLDETDLAFLRRLLARLDADLQVADGRLQVSPRGDVGRGRIALVAEADLHGLRVCADLAEQVTALAVRGWDAVQGRQVEAVVNAAVHPGPGRGRSGAEVLNETFGAREENLGHLAVRDREEAQALAEAAFDRRARRFLRAEGVAIGNPALRVGTTVALSGAGAGYDNEYYVVRTCHRYDGRDGYRTEFSAECAWLGEG
jgi:phage protein D